MSRITSKEMKKDCKEARERFKDPANIEKLLESAENTKEWLYRNEEKYDTEGTPISEPWFPEVPGDFTAVPDWLKWRRRWKLEATVYEFGFHHWIHELRRQNFISGDRSRKCARLATDSRTNVLMFFIYEQETYRKYNVELPQFGGGLRKYPALLTEVNRALSYRGAADKCWRSVTDLAVLGMLDARCDKNGEWTIKLGKSGEIFFENCWESVVEHYTKKSYKMSLQL